MIAISNSRIFSIFLLIAGVLAECQYIAGMYYCEETEFIQFTGVGSSGSYNRVTSFNSDGTCSSTPQSYSGNLAPFDEELSVHFRGPITLENFKVFTKDTSSTSYRKRALHHRHAEPDPEPIMVTQISYDTVFVTVGAGNDVSTSVAVETAAATVVEAVAVTTSSSSKVTSPEYVVTAITTAVVVEGAAPGTSSSETAVELVTLSTGSAGTEIIVAATTVPATAAAVPTATSTAAGETTSAAGATTTATTTTSSSTASSASSSSTSTSSSAAAATGAWTEIASYSASSQSSSGLVFLNNLGGSLSGVWDSQFGSSLSYMASDGVSAAASPECLAQTLVPSNNEFAVFTSTECSGNDCGYYRPGNVAYHGFGGQYKVFVFEFGMPTDDSSSYNQDMPAVWLLNAQIPRTLQYGAESCSCWSTGCGEIDLWEILSTGNQYLTTTIHGNQDGGAGSSNYFARPTSGTLTAAAILDGTSITLVKISEIPDSIDDALIASWLASAGTATVIAM